MSSIKMFVDRAVDISIRWPSSIAALHLTIFNPVSMKYRTRLMVYFSSNFFKNISIS